jgi:hypothetical protein
MSLNTFKTIYYLYFNTIISYSLPFFFFSPHSIKIFWMQKRIVRLMIDCKSRVSYRNLFRRLEILSFVSENILSLTLFVVKNTNLFILNSDNQTKSKNNAVIFISPYLILLYTKGKYVTWALRSSIIFLHTLKIYLIILGNLKFV